MNSLQILKQELVKQKNLLDSKGFPVPVNDLHPSPSEITSAIENINFDFTGSTATAEDVRAGKTFYSKNCNLQTGTLDLNELEVLRHAYNTIFSGEGQMEIIIPTDVTSVKWQAFAINYTSTERYNIFFKHNLTIPPNIQKIGNFAFYQTNLTGKLVIPETCQSLGGYAFGVTNIEELEIYSGIVSQSVCCFIDCYYLKKIYIYQQVKSFPKQLFSRSRSIEELYLPESLEAINSNLMVSSYNTCKFIRFSNPTPCTIGSATFKCASNALIAVPYLSYDAYLNTTNFQEYGNTSCGWAHFEQGSTLPNSMEGYTLIWYPTYQDLIDGTNAVTTCETEGDYYASCTAIDDGSSDNGENTL